MVFWCLKRVLEWETLHFCCSYLRERKRMWKFYLYMKTKVPIRLNIFDTEEFLGSLLREDLLGSLLDPKSNTWEDFWETSL